MTYLITGAHGFIGMHLIRECHRAGIRVIAYDLVRPRYPEPGLQGVLAVEGDILEPMRLLAAMRDHQVQAVIHLVAYGAGEIGREIGLVKAGDYNPLKGAEVNVLGSLNVFEAARLAGVRRVVYASSIAVYGPPAVYGGKTPDEDAPLRPQTLYGAAKAMVEVAAEVYHRQHGLEVVGLRPTFVYGPGRWYRGTVPFVVDLFEGALAKRPVRIEAADVPWDMVYVKDVARAFFLATRAKTPEHRLFNVTGHTARPRDVMEVVKRLVPEVQVEVVPGGEPVFPYGLSGERAKRELGFSPRYSLEEAARDYLADLRSRMKAEGGIHER